MLSIKRCILSVILLSAGLLITGCERTVITHTDYYQIVREDGSIVNVRAEREAVYDTSAGAGDLDRERTSPDLYMTLDDPDSAPLTHEQEQEIRNQIFVPPVNACVSDGSFTHCHDFPGRGPEVGIRPVS